MFLKVSLALVLSLCAIFYQVQAVGITDNYVTVTVAGITGKEYTFTTDPTPVAIDPKIKITLNATSISDKDYVNVIFSGVTPTANGSDYLAVYTPGDQATYVTKAPSKYVQISKLAGFNTTGSGNYTFQMVSSRASYRFVILQGYNQYPTIKAQSAEIPLNNPNKPLHLHLGTTGNCGEMVVQWNTRDNCPSQRVEFGLQANLLIFTAFPVVNNYYTVKDLCGPPSTITGPGFIDPGYTHTVILRGLIPNTIYYYRAGTDEPGFGFTSVNKFRTLNPVGPDEHVFFFATADVGSNEADNSSLTQNEPAARQNHKYILETLLKDDRYNLYHLHGDIAYADGQLTIWDNYFALWSDFIRHLPIVVTEGNHERDYPASGDRFIYSEDNSGGECGIPTYNNFYTPNQNSFPPGQSKLNLWYSFEYGPIHFTHISTERPFNQGSDQWKFVTNDINNVDRRRTPWLVVAGHRPFYSPVPGNLSDDIGSGDGTPAVANDLQIAFEDTFYNNHVDIFWYGHVHRYERTCPAYKNACQGYDADGVPKATIYYDMGNGGYSLSTNIGSPVSPIYSTNGGKIIVTNGYTQLEVNRTHFIQDMIFAANGTLLDRTLIQKPVNWGDSYMKSKGK